MLKTADYARSSRLYETLWTASSKHTIDPWLIETGEPNATLDVCTVKLKKGILVHHGKEMKAVDVIYSAQRLLTPETGGIYSGLMAMLDMAETKELDDYTVVFKLKTGLICFQKACSLALPILPKDFDLANPIGTGPFKLESFTPGQQSVMLRNDNYWRDGKPFADGITHVNFNDETARILAATPAARVEVCDGSIADLACVEALFARAASASGRLDAVVSAAAALHVANFKELTLDDWDAMNATVLRGSAMIAMAATKAFVAAGTKGRMVFTTSISARVADAGLAHYCASKAGVGALVRSLAVDLSTDAIVANSLAPGWINTPMIGEFVDSLAPGALSVMNPQARAAYPDEVARVVRFLVVDAPDFLTGTTITVDGGQTIMNHII